MAIGYAAFHAVLLLRAIHGHEFLLLLGGAGLTLVRVNAALLIGSLWTIPVGVAIGFNPRLSHIAQPLAQIAASFPATALFPLILVALSQIGIGLGVGSVALMLLAAQWYILFNVIAGAQAIPSELREVARLFRFQDRQRWTTVILPGIFPFLITGLITASGGAWNASIVAEYFQLKGSTLATLGLGSQISQASSDGNYRGAAGRDHDHGADGGDHQSAGVASSVSSGGDEVSAGVGSARSGAPSRSSPDDNHPLPVLVALLRGPHGCT